MELTRHWYGTDTSLIRNWHITDTELTRHWYVRIDLQTEGWTRHSLTVLTLWTVYRWNTKSTARKMLLLSPNGPFSCFNMQFKSQEFVSDSAATSDLHVLLFSSRLRCQGVKTAPDVRMTDVYQHFYFSIGVKHILTFVKALLCHSLHRREFDDFSDWRFI
jgi:hypothetical protein